MRALSGRFALAIALVVLTSPTFSRATLAAPARRVISVTLHTGPFRLLFQVRAPEQMVMKGSTMHAMTGERMLGGSMATCEMKKAGGMSMPMAGHHFCNHHIELHVYRAGGAVVRNARVRIVIQKIGGGFRLIVPIMEMASATMGMSDYHYGNNVWVPNGRMRVTVTVNGARASTAIRLP